MARTRTPAAVAAVTGAAAKNPQRHRSRKAKRGDELGDPPSWFNEFSKRAWRGLKKELPWLKESHRGIVELTSMLRGKIFEERGPIGLQAMQELRRCYAQLGATPADESKVNTGNGDEEDPDDAFFAQPPTGAAKPH